MLLDGEDVVKLLKLSTTARKDIEEAARRHGPVVRGIFGSICYLAQLAPQSFLQLGSPHQNFIRKDNRICLASQPRAG